MVSIKLIAFCGEKFEDLRSSENAFNFQYGSLLMSFSTSPGRFSRALFRRPCLVSNYKNKKPGEEKNVSNCFPFLIDVLSLNAAAYGRETRLSPRGYYPSDS